MTYTVRTTPLESCQRAVARADAVTHAALEHIIGETRPAECSARARLPTRLGGLGVTALAAMADAAFLASSYKAGLRAASLWRAPAARPDGQGTADSDLCDIPGMADAAGRLAARLPRGVVELEEHRSEDDGSFRQQSLSLAATQVEADLLMARLGPLDAATLQAARAPGTGRWLLTTPAAHGDMSFPNSFLVTAVKQHLGVATLSGSASSAICRYCGSIRDARGIHDRSCSAGGDNVLHHNSVRDCIHRFAARARLNPTLERTGLLAEPGVLLDWRRPADVLIESSGPRASAGPLAADRLAIDVKVINALGPPTSTLPSASRVRQPLPTDTGPALTSRRRRAAKRKAYPIFRPSSRSRAGSSRTQRLCCTSSPPRWPLTRAWTSSALSPRSRTRSRRFWSALVRGRLCGGCAPL